MIDPKLKAQLTKAIVDRWGHEVAQNPREGWTPSKEQLYLQQIREIEKAKQRVEERDHLSVDGVLLPKKLFSRDSKKNRICSICENYSLKRTDDIYILKFQVCRDCFIQHIEGREEKWKEKNSKNS